MVLPNKIKDAWGMLCPSGVEDIFKSHQDAAPDTSVKKLSLSAQRDCQIVYKKYYARLCMFARHLIGDQHLAEDIVTEAFMNLMETASQSKFDEHQMKIYLHVAIKNKCHNYRKELQIRNKGIAEFEYFFSQPDEADLDLIAELSLLIHKEISKLPPQRKRIVQQLYIEGHTSQQVADMMDLSRQTVINQKVRALKSLREIFSKMIS